MTEPKKRGRPRKTDLAAKKPGNRGAVGRPKGDAAIINEYKSRMLNSPKSEKVLSAIFNAALDNDHKHQAAAWKLIVDRIVPQSAFEADLKKGGGSPSVTINIKSADPSGFAGDNVTIDGNSGEVDADS